MRFLHTSDWHLGKVFHGKSLIEDQKYVLNQIIATMKAASDAGRPYAALVVSGDIYDRAVPPAEAVTVLDDFLIRLTRELPGTHIFLNAGNHDGATRLSFAARFLEQNNIHIATETDSFTKPVIVTQDGEQCALYQLPFLSPLSIKQAVPAPEEEGDADKAEPALLRAQQDLYEEAVAQISAFHSAAYPGIPAVLNAHLFVTGSSVGASERSNVGTLEQVRVGIFKPFAYGAFGHIHKCQPVGPGKRCWYSGALLAYNFDDDPDTGMNEVSIDCTVTETDAGTGFAVSVKRIPFTPLHRIAKVNAFMKDLIGTEADRKLIDENRDNYVLAILKDGTMPFEAFDTLAPVFPHLLSVTMESQKKTGKNASIEERKKAIDSNDPSKIISQFMKELYGETDDALIQAEKDLFVKEAQ